LPGWLLHLHLIILFTCTPLDLAALIRRKRAVHSTEKKDTQIPFDFSALKKIFFYLQKNIFSIQIDFFGENSELVIFL